MNIERKGFGQAEWKILPLTDAKVSSDGNGSLTGYASTFGNIDSYGDTIQPGAYTAHLDTFVNNGFIAWNHDWSAMIGTISTAKQDARGLLITADFHSTPEAQAARTITAERLARGKSVGLSIGYQAVRSSSGELDGEPVRVLEEIKLFETSLVSVPADSFAGVIGIKSHPLTERPSGLYFVPGFKSEDTAADPILTAPPTEASDDDADPSNDPSDSPEQFSEHGERVLLEVAGFVERARVLRALRQQRLEERKSGRVLSDANRRRLSTLSEQLGELQTQIADLLTSTEPAPTEDAAKAAPEPDIEAIYARLAVIEAIHAARPLPPRWDHYEENARAHV